MEITPAAAILLVELGGLNLDLGGHANRLIDGRRDPGGPFGPHMAVNLAKHEPGNCVVISRGVRGTDVDVPRFGFGEGEKPGG
jgi:hypothetical protein